jgi:DNA-binding NtrC family response regulator
MRMLLERAWPGNVRQLQNAVIEIATHLEDGRGEITGADVDRVLGRNLLEVGEREGDVRTIIVPPYIIGEDIDHYFDRLLIAIYNTLLKQTGSVGRVAQLLSQASARTLGQRLNRAEDRLKAAAASANQIVTRLRLRGK